MKHASEKKPFTVTVTTIYALSMAKQVWIRLKGQDNPIVLKADTVETAGGWTTVKNGTVVVGSFQVSELQGWHIVEGK